MSFSRVRDAARHLGVGPLGLADAVCAFVGEPTPASPLARRLLADAFTALDSTPRGILMVHELLHTAVDWPEVPHTLPPTPDEAVARVLDLADLLQPLTAGELRAAAAGFALRRGRLYLALLAEEIRRLSALLGSACARSSATIPTPPEGSRLRTSRPARPPRGTPRPRSGATSRVRCPQDAAGAPAGIGDGLLRVTEHAPAPLEWNRDDERWHFAAIPVLGSPERLEVRLQPEPTQGPVIPGADDPLWPGDLPCPPHAPWRWEVG